MHVLMLKTATVMASSARKKLCSAYIHNTRRVRWVPGFFAIPGRLSGSLLCMTGTHMLEPRMPKKRPMQLRHVMVEIETGVWFCLDG